MSATATKALKLSMKLLDFLEEADIDSLGFDLPEGDGYRTYTTNELRSEIEAGLISLRQGPRQLHALELHALLTDAVDAAGSEAALARQLGVTRQYVHAVRSGHRPPGPAILRHLGMRQVPTGRTLYTPTDG
jgi:transcriptional regulator with XRE-family HTH domain